MAGPWEKYQTQGSAKPWERYGGAAPARHNNVPEFDPGIEGYNPQTGMVERSKAASAAHGAADMATLGFGDEIASTLAAPFSDKTRTQILREMRDMQKQAQADNPGSYLAGQVGGGLAQAAVAGPATFAARMGGAGLGRAALGSALDGALLGGAHGVGSGETIADRAVQGAIGAALGGVIGGAAPAVVSGAGNLVRRAISPAPISAERQAAISVLEREGVPLTAGQKTGNKFLSSAESEIGGARAAQIFDDQGETFTSAALSRAGGSGRATSDNMSRIYDQIGKGFDEVSSRNSMTADRQLVSDISATMQEYGRVLPSEQRQILGNIAADIGEKIKTGNGSMSGKDYQTIRSRLTKRAQNARGSDVELSQAYKGLRNALDEAMNRSVKPQDAGKWQQLRRQYGNLKTLEKAVGGAGGEDAAMGLISPSRLRMAASQGNKGGYARGEGDFAELAKAGQAVMTPPPNSGTAMRTSVRNLGVPVGSAGVGFGLGGIPGALIGAIAPRVAGAAMMSKPAQQYLTNSVASGPLDAATRDAVARMLLGTARPIIAQ